MSDRDEVIARLEEAARILRHPNLPASQAQVELEQRIWRLKRRTRRRTH